MAIYIDRKFIGLISLKLENSSNKGNDLYNFRCPFCGDSAKNKAKKRGYLFRSKQDMVFKCHNCGAGMGLSFFISKLDPALYKEYRMETFQDNTGHMKPRVKKELEPIKMETAGVDIDMFQDLIDRVTELDHTHVCKQYVMRRKIPKKYHSDLYYAEDFGAFVKKTRPDKHHEMMDGQNRLIIPFFDSDKNLLGYQGRILGKTKSLRYITISFEKYEDNVFGLDRIDIEKPVYILEGPIDSMFVENSIGLAGSTKFLGFLEEQQTNTIWVFDNERRSKEIVTLMKKRVRMGFSVFIWPDTIVVKDINELAMNGFGEKDIMELINNNTHCGIAAELKIDNWKRIWSV
jgi:hypothetical protein